MNTKTRILAGSLALGAALAPAALAAGHGDGPKGPKNPNACEGGVKIEPVRDGSYTRTLGGETILVTLEVDEATQVFSFETSSPVTDVVVKGGPGSAPYAYPAPGAASGAGLHAPMNPNSGKYYGLSHVCVFGPAPQPEDPPLLTPPVEEPPAEQPPAEEPPAEEPPAEDPGGVFSF